MPGPDSTDLCARTICKSLGVGFAPCLRNSSAIVLRPNPKPSWGRSSDGTNCKPGSKQQSQNASRTSFDQLDRRVRQARPSQRVLAQAEDVRQFGSQRLDRRIQRVVSSQQVFLCLAQSVRWQSF